MDLICTNVWTDQTLAWYPETFASVTLDCWANHLLMMFTCHENEMNRNAGIVSSMPEGDLQAASFLCKAEMSSSLFWVVSKCMSVTAEQCFWTPYQLVPSVKQCLGCKMGPLISHLETLVNNYQFMMHSNPHLQRPCLYCGGSFKSRKTEIC